MGSSSLTRQELGWLLAQEAQGAAKLLRAEVKELRASLPPAATSDAVCSSSLPAEQSLRALDSAIGMLSDLQSPHQAQPSRARVDLASLLLEVMPHARLRLQPGLGTEVFVDELQLRKLLQLFFSQRGSSTGTTGKGKQVEIQRDDQWVRMTTDLGPDSPMADPVEGRWLHKMAGRLGGRVEVRGRNLNLLLPAENTTNQAVIELKQELAEAQQLGEVYAEELARFMSSTAKKRPPADRAGWSLLGTFARDLLAEGLGGRTTAQLRALAALSDPEAVLLEAVPVDIRDVFDGQMQQLEDQRQRIHVVERRPLRTHASEAAIGFVINELMRHALRLTPHAEPIDVYFEHVNSGPLLRMVSPEVAPASASELNGDGSSSSALGAAPMLTSARCLLEALGGRLQSSKAAGRVERCAYFPR